MASKFFKRTLLVTTAIIVLGGGVLLVAPKFISPDMYKDQVIAQVEKATGRKLTIGGEINLRFLPRIELSLGDVHLSNPKGFSKNDNADMVSAKEFSIALQLWPLLHKQVIVDKFLLDEPKIDLAVNAQGKENWVFESANAEAVSTEPHAEAQSGKPMGGSLSLPEVMIQNGSISYVAAAGVKPVTMDKLNLKLELPEATSPLIVSGDGVWNSKVPVEAKIKLDNLAQWQAGEQVSVNGDAQVGDTLAKVELEGKVQPKANETNNPDFSGNVRFTSDSLRKLGSALDMEILPADMPTEGKISVRSIVTMRGASTTLSALSIMFDDLTLTGKVVADTATKPVSLSVEMITQDPLVVDHFVAPAPQPVMAGRHAGEMAPAKPAAESYSKEPVLKDISALKQLNLDAKVELGGGIRYNELALSPLRIDASVKKGQANFAIPAFAFHGGSAAIKGSLAQEANTPVISVEMDLRKFDLGEFLQKAEISDKLSGQATSAFAVQTSGVSVYDWVNHLNGNGDLHIRDGAMKGVDFNKMMQDTKNLATTVKGTQTYSSQSMQGARTDFSAVDGSFVIRQGILHNEDLTLKAPVLNVTGAGDVNLPAQQVNYRLNLGLVKTAEGQDRSDADTKRMMEIPVLVRGPFSALTFAIDMQGLLQDALSNPDKVKEKVEKVKESLHKLKDTKALKENMKSFFKGL